jgi:MFS family permease
MEDKSKKAKFFVLIGLVVMELVATVDITGVTVLVPTLQNNFNIPSDIAGWVLMAFLIPFALFLVPLGWLTDKTGQPEKMITLSILGFSFFSILCAIAPNENYLILFRILKGICAAGMFTSEFVIIIKYWEDPRRIVEIVIAGIAVGILIGPLVGAAFATDILWRFFFLIGALLALGAFLTFQNFKNLTPVKRDVDQKFLPERMNFGNKVRYLTKMLFWGMLLNFALALTTQGTNFLITLHVQEHLGKSPMFNGMLLAIVAAGVLAANAIGIGSRFVKNLKIAAWGSAGAIAITLITLNFTDWVSPAAYINYFVFGIFLGISLSTVELMILKPLPISVLALGNGLVVTSMHTGYGLVSSVIPLLYLNFGTDTTYFLAGTLLFVILIFITFQRITRKE